MKMLIIVLSIFCLSAIVAWGEPFLDDFDRADNDELGEDWSTQIDGTITVKIADNEALISGAQGTDWQRSGLFRTIEDETKIYFDFLANDNFNIHVRIDDTATGAYIDLYASPGGSFSYASSPDGGWPGWTPTGGAGMLPGQYNTIGIEKDEDDFIFYLNDKEISVIENKNLENITKVLIASDTAAGTVGSLHIDNVIIGDAEDGTQKSVAPAGKLAIRWGELKQL